MACDIAKVIAPPHNFDALDVPQAHVIITVNRN
jgi:hypothetical protein